MTLTQRGSRAYYLSPCLTYNKVVLLKESEHCSSILLPLTPPLCPCSTYILFIFFSLNKLYICLILQQDCKDSKRQCFPK